MGIIVLIVVLNILPFYVWGQEEFSVYEDQEGRFTIDYPSDWIVNEEPSRDDKESVVQFDSSEPDMTSFGADLSIPSVRVGISDAKPDETSLEALTNKKVKDLESIGMPTQETERTTLSGLPAHSIKSTIGDEPAKNVFALYDGKVYQIIFRAHSYEYDNLLPTFQQMIDSFQIMNQTLGQEGDSTSETPRFPTPPAIPENDGGNEDDQSTDEDLFG